MQTDSVEKAAGIGAIGLWAALHGWLGWLVVLYAVCMMLDWVKARPMNDGPRSTT